MIADPRVWHQDGGLLVVEKPAGLLCQPGLGPALADSLLTRLRRQWPAAQLVHRLDRDTSGLLLLARDADAHRALSRAFAERRVRKTYRADVWGQPAGLWGRIEAPLARARCQPPQHRVHPLGRPSRTLWRRLASDGATTRLALRPRTGRSHQLRVHLAWLGHPILGDPLYGCAAARALAPGLRLHALRLGFPHPQHGRWVELAVEPPWQASPLAPVAPA